MRSATRAISLIIAILVALTLAAPVAAGNKWAVTSKQAGTNAFAFTQACIENADGTTTCDGQSIDVFEGTIRQTGQPTFNGQQVCYSEHHVTFNPITGQTIESRALSGCTLNARTLTIRKLNSITLAPTVVELTEMVCDATTCTESAAGSITIHGTWTGVGPTMSQRGKFRFDDGTCIQVSADQSNSRLATFVGSIDAPEGRIAKGSFTFKTSCPM
jgi:hypothetical protein